MQAQLAIFHHPIAVENFRKYRNGQVLDTSSGNDHSVLETFTVKWKELIESLRLASGNSSSLSIKVPLIVSMELTEKDDKCALMLQLVNFIFKNSYVQNTRVDIQVPEGKKIKQVTGRNPDGRDNDILQFKESGKRIVSTVLQLSLYNIVVMKLE